MLYLLAMGALGALYAIVLERHWWAIRRFEVPCLPPGSDPLRILHLSDLHFRRGQGLKRRFLASLADQQPDVVVVTGDFLGDHRSSQAVVTALAPIRARVAKLFVLGSNDYYSPVFKNPLRYFVAHSSGPEGAVRRGGANPWEELARSLEADGWTFMNNRMTQLSANGSSIEVGGLDDAHIGRARPDVITARVGNEFRLAVAHSPDSIQDLVDKGFDLILCGHTHGGQVCLPGVGALVTNCDIPRSWARGLHRAGESWLHVSAGLGTSMFAPYRFACRPEVSVLDLEPRP